ncbi:hypothetical protein PGC35_20945 [Psychrobacillus sp. PGGUH221]|uniref:hypothetical protein n=1 Tax=Psychrobacillus sp. PGGUH221 TaxID=3020058 RepID=UPI0035C6D5B2
MTNTITPIIKKSAKKYKRWNETEQIFPYKIFINEKNYIFINYFRMFSNKVVGAIVLEENGEVSEREKAIEVANYVASFNAKMGIVRDQLYYEKDRPDHILKNCTKLIDRVSSIFDISSIQQDVNIFKEFSSFYIKGQERLKEIFHAVEKLLKQVRFDLKCLTKQDVKHAEDLIFEYYLILFNQSNLHYKALKHVPNILEFIRVNKENIESSLAKDYKNLESILGELISPKSKKTLMESAATAFPGYGSVWDLPEGKEGEEEFIRLKKLEGSDLFNKLTREVLRN